jgi:ATP-dependent helicase/nuclease subunit B
LIVTNVIEELEHSRFQPISFELGFGEQGALPPVELTVDGITLSVSGIVDRVDGWERDGRLYLRVVDYKTGKKSFRLTDVWHGLELQMLLYLFTLEGAGKTVYHRDLVAAGVLYLPARDLILSGSRSITPAQRQKEVDQKLRRSGMLLNDPDLLRAMEQVEPGGKPRFLPVRVSNRTGAITGDSLATAEQWGKLHRHVGKVLRDIAGELATGNIDADPYLRAGNRSYCDFCDYADACLFEEGNGRDCHRYLYSVKGKQFWEGAGVVQEDEKKRGE